MSFDLNCYTPEEWEKKYGQPAGEAIFETCFSNGERPYEDWVAPCGRGKVAIAKVFSKIKKNKVFFVVIIEFLDKQKIWQHFMTSKTNFDKTIQNFLKAISDVINKLYKVKLEPWVRIPPEYYIIKMAEKMGARVYLSSKKKRKTILLSEGEVDES